MLGLSATPLRKDGLDQIGRYYFGKIIYNLEIEQDSDIQVNIYVYNPEERK